MNSFEQRVRQCGQPLSQSIIIGSASDGTNIGASQLSGQPSFTPTPDPSFTISDLLTLLDDWRGQNFDSTYDLNYDTIVNSYDYAIMVKSLP
jgi:hypothetical protein